MKYKVATGSNSNAMPINVSKILFPKATMEQMSKHKNKNNHIMYIQQNKHSL